MYHLVIFTSFAFMIFSVTNVDGLGMELMSKLNNEIDRINDLIAEIQQDFHDQMNPYELISNYLSMIIKKTDRTLKKTLLILEDIQHNYRKVDSSIEEKEHAVARNTRRSKQPEFEKEFYAILAKVLKNKLQNEPLINEKEIDSIIGQHVQS